MSTAGDSKEHVSVEVAGAVDYEKATKKHEIAERAGLALVEEKHILPSAGPSTTTSKLEFWAYCFYYAGNSGLGNFSYGPAIFQVVLNMGGFDPDVEPYGSAPCGAGRCYLNFAGSNVPLSSVVLDASGIQFAIQVAMVILIGAWADYGTWRRWICKIGTISCWAIGLGWLAIKDGSQWHSAMALEILSLISFTIAITYYLGSMPGVARDLPEMKAYEQKVLDGEMDPAELVYQDMLMRNKVADYALFLASFIPVAIMGCACGILRAIKPDESALNNLRGYTVTIAFATGFLIIFTIPWLVLEQRRPGQSLPPGSNMFTVGFKNCLQAAKEIRKMKQALIYLIAYILLSEGQGTSATIISTLQYDITSYSAETVLYMTMLQYGTQGIGFIGYWLLQKHYRLQTKTLLMVNVVFATAACIWGFVGIWTPTFGYKNVWEIWLYMAIYGFFLAPWYQFSLTFLSDIIPGPKLYIFWSLFTIWGKSSSFVCPFITSAIIRRANGNENMAFAFLLPIMVIGAVLVMFVDAKKATIEGKAYIDQEAKDLYKIEVPAAHIPAAHVEKQ